MESNTPDPENDKYVHLIGGAEIKYEDGRFKLYFLNDKGNVIRKAKPLEFPVEAKSVKFLNIHLIAEFWNQKFNDQMENFEKALPFLKALIQPDATKQSGIDTTIFGRPPENTDLPFHPFMNPTDPPTNVQPGSNANK